MGWIEDTVTAAVARIRSGQDVDVTFLRDRIGDRLAALDPERVFDPIALEVARRFESGRSSYGEGDEIMNAVWSLMLDEMAATPGPFSPLALAVYEAFDAGEFDLGDGVDRVEAVTRPLVRELLSTWSGSSPSGDGAEP